MIGTIVVMAFFLFPTIGLVAGIIAGGFMLLGGLQYDAIREDKIDRFLDQNTK